MAGWKVWGELRRRTHIELVVAYMPDNSGLIEDMGGGRRRITLDSEIDQCERRAVLAHELIHDERDILFDDDTPVLLMVKEEALVEAETARRLVPIDELELLVRARVLDGGNVTWRDIAEWFDVPREICEQAYDQLNERARQRHATARAVRVPHDPPPGRRVQRPFPPAEDGPHTNG